MKEEKVIYIDKIILAITIIILIVVTIMTFVKLRQQSVTQQETIMELRQKIVESEVNREWVEDYIDLINEIWEKELENRVLENEIKWLKNVNNIKQSNIIPNQQVYDDFEIYVGLVARYYNDEITIPIESYIEQQNPILYARINQYQEIWG